MGIPIVKVGAKMSWVTGVILQFSVTENEDADLNAMDLSTWARSELLAIAKKVAAK